MYPSPIRAEIPLIIRVVDFVKTKVSRRATRGRRWNKEVVMLHEVPIFGSQQTLSVESAEVELLISHVPVIHIKALLERVVRPEGGAEVLEVRVMRTLSPLEREVVS